MPFIPDKPTPGFQPDPTPTSIPIQKPGYPGMQSYLDNDPTLKGMAESGFGMGGLSQVGKPAAGIATAIGKIPGAAGDKLMQFAAGMKKFIPGVGKTMANEGVMGTRGMMANQVENAMGKRGAEIGSLAESVPEVSSDVPAQRVLDKAQDLVQADGYLPSSAQSDYKRLLKLSDEVGARGGEAGVVSGQLAGEARAAAGQRARQAGAYRDNPSEAFKAQAASAEQGGWSQALKDAYAKQNPGMPNKLAEADAAYSHLAQANQTLSMPESITQSPLGMKLSSIPGSSLGSSLAGRGLIGLEKFIGGRPMQAIGSQSAIKAGRSRDRK